MDNIKFHFKDLHPNEKILHVVHRNWFYIFQQFVLVFFVSIILFGSMVFVPIFFPDFFSENNRAVINFFENLFVLMIWTYSFMLWIDYYYDIWIITTERIINIEQKGMFTRVASELRFKKIQDVKSEVIGFLPTIFNYGDVKVQTAGEENEFIFRTVSDPYEIKRIIMDLQKGEEEHSKQEFEKMIEGN